MRAVSTATRLVQICRSLTAVFRTRPIQDLIVFIVLASQMPLIAIRNAVG